MSDYTRTDLAVEAAGFISDYKTEDYRHHRSRENNVFRDTVEILSDRGAKALAREMGTYVTFSFTRDDIPALHKEIAQSLRTLIGEKRRILTVGLGNRDITADAIGPITVGKLTVNGHLDTETTKHFAISPDVLGKTGIESYVLIKAAVISAKADAVIAVDALAARDAARLYHTVQIGTSGIIPGSGVGNHRHALTEATLGVPVIAIGVPTIVSSATLLYNTLEKANLLEYQDALKQALLEIEPFFVTPPDADIDTELLADAIAKAIDSL